MAQGKGKGKAQGLKEGPAQRHLHSRISYLYQAATYLADATRNQERNTENLVDIRKVAQIPEMDDRSSTTGKTGVLQVPLEPLDEQGDINKHRKPLAKDPALSCHLLSHVRAVSLKGVIRLTPAIKHSICKRCHTLLIPGSTAVVEVENKSCNARKPWADILVITCSACDTAKKIPVGAKRQPRRNNRVNGSERETQHHS